jgi:hypothetical protein
MAGENGVYKEGILRELHSIQKGVDDIKDDLAHSIDKLTVAVNTLTNQFSQFIRVAENSIPVRAVMWMFGILVLAMIGVEGVQYLAEHAKSKVL